MNLLKWTLGVLLLSMLISGCGREEEAPVEESVVEEQEVIAEEPIEEVVEEPIEEVEEVESQEPAEDAKEEIEEEPEVEEEEAEELDLTGLAMNPLTGQYIDEVAAARRPIGIMINNHRVALPQSGLAQADVIYETLVEGGIARLFALYQDFDATKIGPVRSARHYYLDFAFDFDALYVHYGQSPQADVAFKELNAPNMNGLSYLDTIMCFQDPTRKRPHSTYTSYDGLMAAWDSKDYRVDLKEGLYNKFTFTDEVLELEEAELATKVVLDYSYYQYAWFEYDESSNKYLRFQFDVPHMDVEIDEQLAFDNIIVQLAEIWKIPGDSEGRMDMNLTTKGDGYYISQGKHIPITWEKISHYDPTVYYTLEGQVLEMAAGKTWISVFPTYRVDQLIIE